MSLKVHLRNYAAGTPLPTCWHDNGPLGNGLSGGLPKCSPVAALPLLLSPPPGIAGTAWEVTGTSRERSNDEAVDGRELEESRLQWHGNHGPVLPAPTWLPVDSNGAGRVRAGYGT